MDILKPNRIRLEREKEIDTVATVVKVVLTQTYVTETYGN